MSTSPALCSTCASSLLPSRPRSSTSTGNKPKPYFTPCCGRPICETCLGRNPRLRGYDPCLGCLGGVGAVRGEGWGREEEVWVVGGDEEEDEGSEQEEAGKEDKGGEDDGTAVPPISPGLEVEGPTSAKRGPLDASSQPEEAPDSQVEPQSTVHVPYRHLIKPTDTLLGLSMKYKVDGHALCRLNNLPPSTLRTTPHLLHTRTYLILPPSAAPAQPCRPPSPESEERKRERAIKRFQIVTKEVDVDVARAYVGLEDEDVRSLRSLLLEHEGGSGKGGKGGKGREGEGGGGNEERAVERYMDDEVWEREELGAGRGGVRGAPWFSESSARAGSNTAVGSSMGGGGWMGWFRSGVETKAG